MQRINILRPIWWTIFGKSIINGSSLEYLWGDLTYWGRVTLICVGNLAIIGSDNGLSPDQRQAIILTNAFTSNRNCTCVDLVKERAICDVQSMDDFVALRRMVLAVGMKPVYYIVPNINAVCHCENLKPENIYTRTSDSQHLDVSN